MANPKWIKWAVGLGGTAFFAGFVGYLSGGQHTEPVFASDGQDSQSAQTQQNDSGYFSSGNSGISNNGGFSNDGGFSGDSQFSDNGGGNDSGGQFGRCRMRTRAS